MFSKGKKKPATKNAVDGVNPRSTLNFLFNPNIADDIRPIGENIGFFVKFVAAIFASNGLFPKDHPALLGVPGHRLTLGKVIYTAYKNVSFTRQDLPRALLFTGIVGCLALSFLAVITAILLAFTGTANAAEPTGIFEPKDATNDVALKFVDYLFFGLSGTELSALPADVSSVLASNIMQKSLTTALSIYSTAALVIGGVILLYHLLSMVAETAHTGKPMGRASQIWAPIRLVVAIGLLVPVSSGGLNVAQSIAIQISKWGSGLASYTWSTFLEAYASNVEDLLKKPSTPLVDKLAEDLVIMNACAYGYNSRLTIGGMVDAGTSTGFWASLWGFVSSYVPGGNLLIGVLDWLNPYKVSLKEASDAVQGTVNGDTVDIGNRYDYANISGAVCGYFFTWNYTGTIYGNTPGKDFFEALYTANKNTIVNFSKNDLTNKDGTYGKIPHKIIYLMNKNKDYSDCDGTDCSKYVPLPEDLKTVSDYLKAQIQSNIKAAFDANENSLNELLAPVKSLEKSGAYGWMSAGAWFNTIARLQGILTDAVYDSLPTTVTPFEKDPELNMLGKFGFVVSTQKVVIDALTEYRGLITGMTSGYALPPNLAEAVATSGISTDNDKGKAAGIVLKLFQGIDKLGSWYGAWPSSEDKCDTIDQGRSCLMFKLTSSNPLGELAWIGHNNLKLGLGLVGWAFAVDAGGSAAEAFYSTRDGLGAFLTKTFGWILPIVGKLMAMFGLVFITSGVAIAYVLPMLPFVRFFFNIMNWLIMIFEAVVSMPIFALAHLNPMGEGLPGDMARQGYFFLFAILLRPVLMVFGLIAGLLLFCVSIAFLNDMFRIATASTGEAAAGGGFATLAKFIYSIMYLVLAYICANTCFKAIGHFPDNALSWMSSRGPNVKDLGDQGTFEKVMVGSAAFIGNKAVEPVTSMASSLGEKAGNALSNTNSGNITGQGTEE